MIISEIQSEIGHCSCDSAKFKAPADFSHHAILCMTLSLRGIGSGPTLITDFGFLCSVDRYEVMYTYGHVSQDFRVRNENLISYFSTKTYVVGTQKNRLNETVPLSTQDIC